MKRTPALRNLSSDHHSALVLARRLTRPLESARGDEMLLLCRNLRRVFETELAPHFQFEEERLLPLLRAAGETALAERTLLEHREMRELIEAIACHPGRDLALSFGALLETHVRFEERVLFPAAEAAVPPETLARALTP